MMKPLFTLAPLAAAVLAGAAFAQTTTSTIVLQPVQAQAGTDNNSAVQTTASRQEIQAKMAGTPAEVLNSTAGIQVGGSAALNSIITLHGAPDDLLNVTVDGARQEGYMFHHSGNFNIDPALLKQVTVNSGTTSIRDVDSQAGSVKFETVNAKDLLAPDQAFGGLASYRFTTNKEENDVGAALYGRAADNVDLLAYGHYVRGHQGKDGEGNSRAGASSKQKNALVKANWDISAGQSLTAGYEHYYNNADNANMRANFGYNPNWGTRKYETKRDTATLRYQINPADNPFLDLDATAYYTKTGLAAMQPVGSANASSDDYTTTKTVGVKAENTSHFQSGSLTNDVSIGAEWRKTTNHKPQQGSEQLSQFTLYAEDEIGINNRQFVITPGARFDHYKADYSGLQKDYNNASFSLAGRWNIDDNIGVFLGATQIYQAPPMQETYIMGRYGYAADLDAVKGWNYQGGIDGRIPLDNNAELTFGATAFYTDFSNMIETVSQGRGQPALYSNVGKAHVKGAELKAGFRGYDFNAGISYSRARSKVDATGNPAYRHGDIGDTLNLSLGYNIAPIDTSLNWNSRFVKGIDSKNGGTTYHKTGYGVSDFTVNYHPQGRLKGLEVNAGVYNVFDKYYVEHASYLGRNGSDAALGRNYRMGLKYQF